jgi:hypothetical protein
MYYNCMSFQYVHCVLPLSISCVFFENFSTIPEGVIYSRSLFQCVFLLENNYYFVPARSPLSDVPENRNDEDRSRKTITGFVLLSGLCAEALSYTGHVIRYKSKK